MTPFCILPLNSQELPKVSYKNVATPTVSQETTVVETKPLFSSTIPVVDMLDLFRGDSISRTRFVTGIREALSTVGFFAVINTGVDQTVIEKAYDSSQKFFALPKEEKLKLYRPETAGQRGLIPKENAKGLEPDAKEYLHIGREFNEETTKRLGYQKNVWPEDEEFKPAFIDMYKDLEGFVEQLLEAIAESIGQPKDLFNNMTKEGDWLLRALHYFANPPKGTMWAGKHTDIDLITAIPKATCRGLQIKNKKGEWDDVEVPEGAFIINAGDMLRNMTNGEYISAEHRVMAPEEKDIERYSIVLFVHPRSDDQIGPLEKSIQRTGGIKKYADGTRWQFLMERLIDTNQAPDEMIKEYAECGLMDRQINVKNGSVPAMKVLREKGYASQRVLSYLKSLEG